MCLQCGQSGQSSLVGPELSKTTPKPNDRWISQGERVPYGIERGERCKRATTATQKRKGPMQVKGPTEMNFKQVGGQKISPCSPTFRIMVPLTVECGTLVLLQIHLAMMCF